MADLVAGLGVGVAYGLLAAAVAVASRATRALHLAIGPVAIAGAMLHLVAVASGTMPPAASLALGAGTAAVLSAATEPLVTRIEREPGRSVAMFAYGAVIAVVAGQWVGARTVRPEPVLEVADVVLLGRPVDGDAITALLVGLPVVVGLAVALRRTTWGARVRLVGGSPEAAEAIGVDARRLRAGALALAGVLGVVAVLVAAPLTLLGLPQSAGLTLRAVAASFLARDRPLPAVAVGVGFGLAEAALQSVAPAVGADAAVAAVALAVLLTVGADHRRAWGRTW